MGESRILERADGRHVLGTPYSPLVAARYRCSVLVVDDEPAILGLLRRQLAHEFEVHTANSVADAQAVVGSQPVDVVVTDLQLPDGSGIGLLDWVRVTNNRIARVLLTGAARLEDAAEAINRCQVQRLVLKPWTTEDLLNNLRGVCRTLLLERSHEQLLDEYRGLNQELERRVADRTLELKRALEQLEHKNQLLETVAETDFLTGLPNRRAVDKLARRELGRRARSSPVALGLVDIDHFKDINTRHTHDGGDHVLGWFGGILQKAVRTADSVGRHGGEEFLVFAPDTDATGAAALGERIRTTFEREHTQYAGADVALTVSVGFAVAGPGPGVGFEQLYRTAATALQEAKGNGRNACVVTRQPSPVEAAAG